MKPVIVLLFLVLLSSGCVRKTNLLSELKKGRWIDLTHAFDENSIYWPTNIPFDHDTVFAGINDKGYFYSSFKFSAEEHGGTHFDAPMHFSQGDSSIEKVPVEKLTGEGVLIDVSAKTERNSDYQIIPEDIEAWETKNGRIPEDAILLFRTGFGKFYPDKEKYTGTTLSGQEGVDNLHFPGIHPETAQWMASNRKIKAVGLDTPSIDFGQSKDFMTHRILFANHFTAYENVANLDKLPEKGFWIMAFPMKIKGGSGAPLRIVAFLPAEN